MLSKLSKNVETFISCDSEYEQAKIVLFGAGFDGTTSFRPGTRFAPAAIRGESFGIETYSPYQDKDMEDYDYFDSGDLELPFGNTEQVLEDIERRAEQIFSAGKLPFMIGGEHLVTLGAVRAAAKKYPDMHIVHFDAHADLRDEYLGQRLSHACVLRRCHDILGDGRIHQFGIRSGEREEFLFAKTHTDMHKLGFGGLDETLRRLRGENVYLTVDLDVLDPSIFPGTGTPEAGGATFEELRRALTEVCGSLNIIACDVNELSPHYDQSGTSTAVACKIIREMLLAMS
jgi:agmatinase